LPEKVASLEPPPQEGASWLSSDVAALTGDAKIITAVARKAAVIDRFATRYILGKYVKID
jgi:hypothetical protein